MSLPTVILVNHLVMMDVTLTVKSKMVGIVMVDPQQVQILAMKYVVMDTTSVL